MIERAMVACPGPSLRKTWKGNYGSYDMIHAVNRAMLVVRHADWLSAADPICFKGLLLGHRPIVGVVTAAHVAKQFTNAEGWGMLTWATWEEIPAFAEHMARGRPMSWSVQAALIHAAHLGAKHIDLLGCDGAESGTEIDCTGYAGEDRTPERWRREALDLALTTQILAEKGTIIHRI